MASAAAGDAMGEAVRTITKKTKRISDYLADSDGADEAEGAAAAASAPSPETPRLRILPAMFTCARLWFVGLGRKGCRGGGQEEVVAAEKSEAASVGSSGSNAGSSCSTGMGLGLLFLLARTCVELNKMAEVRAQMEALLEEMRDQLATTKATVDHHHADAPRTIRGDLPPSTASPCRAPGTDDGRAASSSSAMETASSDADDATSEDEDPAAARTMDAAGAGRYQLNRNSEEETSELSSDGEFIVLDGGFDVGDRLRPRDTEDEEEEEEDHVVDGGEGVSVLELERRLHELLHQRSRERIEELESSLRRAERKLVEKEMEARLWKDTAQLALQPPQQQQQDVISKLV